MKNPDAEPDNIRLDYNENVEKNVHRCIEVLADSLGYSVSRKKFPRVFIVKGIDYKGGYNPKHNFIAISDKEAENGWVLAEEAAHAISKLTGKWIQLYKAPWYAEECRGRLGARIIEKCARETGLEHLFTGKERSMPEDIELDTDGPSQLWETASHIIGYRAAEKANLDNISEYKDLYRTGKKAAEFVNNILGN